MRAAELKLTEMLNTLVGINTNRIECYNFIAAKTDISVLQVLFSRLCETSIQCRAELVDEVYKAGSKPQTGTLVTREFFKAWLDIHEALETEDHKAILDACFYEENVASDTYERFLLRADDTMPGYLRQLLASQYEMLKEDLQKVSNLRSALLRAA
jgi:uncharacterized protein (TIGR02284 family)